MAVRAALLVICALVAGGAAVYNRDRDRQRADPRLLDRACELSSCYPATGNLLIGREARLSASSTCGSSGRERYCIVSHLEERKKCFWCDSTNSTMNNPSLNHRIQNIIYKYYPGTRVKSWWQSENGKENVTIQLDMEAEFHLTHLIIQFKTFRPAAMLVERSFDFGNTWRVYRYFAHNCHEAFPSIPRHSQRSLTEVVCESRYSGVAPSTEGEVIFRVLPPNINVTNPYSEEVQNLLRMTNLRINFTKLHTLGDDLLDNRAEIQEKYYYSIYEMTVRGSCSCYGHASRCLPMPGVESKNNMVHGRCECTHNTRGLNCEYCEEFYNDLPWQPAVGKTSNACKRCTCNNHATTCHFDAAVYNKTGKISGGVCDNCQHNTMGVNCERCMPTYYKDPRLDIQSPDVCQPCDCDPEGTTDKEVLCDDETDVANNKTAGRCLCKANVDGLRCDRCKDGYWNFDAQNPDGCEACTCDSLGTINERGCDPATGVCFCKRHVTGRNCDQCLPEFYGLSDSDDGCSPCDCDLGGSIDRDCDVITGQCKCRPNVTGRRCDQPLQNYFVGALDSIVYEAESSQCNSQIDDNAIQSQLCHVVIRENYPDGRKETWTGPGFMKVPESSTLVFVINNLKTSMNYNVLIRYEPQTHSSWEEATILVKRPSPIDADSPCANVRPEDDTIVTKLPVGQHSVLVRPAVCLEKDKETEIRIYLGKQDGRSSNSRATVLIDSIVLIPSFDDLPFLKNGSSGREEFDRYNCGDSYYYDLNRENIPEVCKKYHSNIGFYIRNGSEPCQCDPSGSKSHQCNPFTGNCQCVENIVGVRCDRCAPGTYGFSKFGCKRCDCNSIGSLDNFCDAASGQCKCRANTYGRACDLCQPGYFNFPNCQQCDCNGHAVECDDKTGACKECQENTEGHRCERCIEGYYGDPRLGIDIPCRLCPCPGVKGDPNKSSHADRCELDPETKDVVCDCKEGYAGLLCDVCADNYYGDPMKGTCEKCECNDNTDITKPGNCDPYTGKCLKCLHNTAGEHCEVCEEGYYGNALEKACYKCNCSVLGTNFTQSNCDGITGQCPCFNNVMGINCDQCTENHWRIALGTGCDPCECDPVGSISPQCNPYIGKCDCKPGHGGRQCDQCQENHWGDPNIECYECDCDIYGSVSQQCSRENGSCICKPGIGGYKCDMCARGYLGEAPECNACGDCFDNWDRVIGDLKVQTEYAIGNASKIKVVGATGAYTRDFEEMTKKLSQVEATLESAKQGKSTVKELLSNVTNLQNKLSEAEKKVKDSNDNLNAITSKINLGNVTLNGLRARIDTLKSKTFELGNNATKLQEANLEGALNLTREAKERAVKAAEEAEGVQSIIANTDRQIKNTDRLIEMQYSSFNNTQNETDKELGKLRQQLTELEMQLPKINEKMCGQDSDSCDICGGAGCGKCGGISCDQGAITKAEQALDFANKTEHRIKEHELTAEDLLRSVSQVKQDTVAVRSRARDLFNRAIDFKASAERATNESQEVTSELKEFLSKTYNTPEEVRQLATEILNLSISIEPKEITELSQRINSTVSQLTNIENIITETKPDLDRAKALKQNATNVNQAANLTLEMANKVLEALDEAQAAQDAAENAIDTANRDIEAAKEDLLPIALETEQAQKKANETMDEVEGLRSRLSDLQKNILKIESDAEQVKQEANDVVNKAEGAEQKARQLRQDFKQTNTSLTERANQTSSSRERAQLLLNRATKLASDTQSQLKLLANMEELYNDHNEQLNDLEKEIGELNTKMNYYLSEITKRSDYYRWLYLEPILYNDDGDLGVKFRKVDLLFKQVARIIEADPRVSALVHSTRLKPMLDAITDQLNACQSALNQYMEEKRSVFPRLYFLSDDDLLELLGQARAGAQGREVVMQTHLKKLFPGITGVRLGPGGVSLTTLCSQYGEMFTLDQPVDIDCSVEVWLNRLELEIRSSLKSLTLKCLAKHGSPHQDPFSLPTQILCLLQNIRFTEQAESAILTKDLRKLKDNIEKEHIYYAEAEVDNENEKCKRQALILQCSYYASVVDSLIEKNVVATSDWLWQKQLRFYLVNKEEVVAKMGLAQISYSYEYLGVVTGQFVRTESTDDSFLILTQALHLGFVGNPFGPAGTGKTESVKALGSLVGRLVLVFNCDEAMDACCLARLLSGVARCGAWGCFDEFNRLERPALAAAAHQLTALLAALTARDEHVVLQGKKVPLSQWCGVAVTLNPAGRGYGGRRELPAALQAALRPLALRPPPSSLLASRLLAAHAPCRDPDHYHRLGEDLDCVFQLASTLLSSQRHYDWGLRALKAAVSSCGAALAAGGAEGQLTWRRAVLRRVLRLNNLSKLTPDDAERFENILSLVFAEVPEEQVATDPVRAALEEAVHRLGLVTNDIQIQKCVELYEQLQQRMGVVIVGPPGSGKTTIRRLLKTALVSRGRSIVEYVIRPKALERGWLLGAAAGSSATTGVLHTVALQATAQDDETWSWVVCDGDIDPDWVEGLNSVLDDNRLLCLPTGERVCLRRGVSFLFETDALSAASPATLTRLAPILLSEDSDCSREVLERWSRRTESENETMKQTLTMMRDVTEKVHAWMKRNSTELVMKHCGVSTVTQIISQFEHLLAETSSDVRVLGVEELAHTAVLRGATSIIKQRAIEDFYREMQLSPAPLSAGHSLHSLQGPRLRSASLILQPSLLHSHALLLGPVASGKNVLAEYVMRETFSTVVVIDCTPVLEPSDIIEELKRRNLVGGSSSRSGGRAAGGAGLLVRSLHRAARDSWGSVRVHDFLLQLIQEGGFWSMEGGAPQWLSVCRFTLLVTAAAVSRLSPRLSAALQPLVITEPDDDELLELSQTYLRDSIPTDIPDGDVSDLVRRMLTLYKEVVTTFDSQPHYSWNCSHIRRWCENVKLYCPTNTTDIWTAITAEAHMIFRERLITADERSQYETIVQKHLPGTHPRMFYRPKMRNDAIYLERLEEEEWYRHTQKTINQCLTDDEQAFGDVAVETCEELTLWIIAAATALSGCVSTCVSSEGAGRRAGARLAAAALGAATHTLTHERHLHTLIHDALSSAVSGRSLLVVCGSACSRLVLGSLEALLSADSFQSLPSAMVPSTGNNTPSLANIKQNLGIMICLDKDQEKLKELMEEFPLLHESSRLCWLEGWSDDTLRKMPSLVIHRLMKEDAQGESQEELNTVPVEGFVAIYKTVEEGWLRSPARYIHFIKAYYHILSHKRTALMQRKNMLAVGVKALSIARGTVATLQGQAEEQERALGLERAAAADALQQMGATVRAATSRKEDMQRLKDDIQAENEKLQLRKKEIEAELASVEPVVAAARAAVGDIRPEALSEVRSLRAPPEVVRDVLEGVLRLMGIADTSWHSMKNFLSKRGVKEDIRHLDAADISPEAAAAVSRLVERRAASFTAESARRASAAVAPLAAWVRANLEHVHALSRVRPLQEQQRELHERLRRAEEEVAALSSGLVSVEGRVSELQEQLGQHAHEAAALEHKLQLATHTLRAATTLLDQLGHEARTWDGDLQNISIEILELNQRSLLAAGYLLYLPHLTEQQARENLLRWSSLIQYEDANFSVINFLSSSEEQLCWQAEGLPTDLSAAKNALTLHQFLSGVGLRPLLVDPEGEARTWLKLASTVSMETVSGGGRELGVVMQQAQRTGGTLLVTEADQLEGWWWSAPGAARAVLLTGDTAMLERLEPHIRATLAPLLFTSRLDALLDQLVNYAIEKRHPEMFEKWKEMKLKTATLQKQQHEAQEHLLKELSVSRDILQDEGLVAALDGARAATGEVTAARAEQEALAKAVAESAEACRPPALTAARLALAVRRLASRRPLLALPATALRDAFLESLDKDQEQVTKHFVKKTLERVMLSVHRRERWVVMLHLMKHVHQDLVKEKLWQLLVNNFNMEVRDENSIVELQNKYHWMSKNSARKVALIKTLDEDLFERLSLGQWTSEGDLFVLEGAPLSPGERVLVAAALNPGALHQAVMQCVEQLMGDYYYILILEDPANFVSPYNQEGTSFTDGEAVPRALRCSAPGQPVLLLAPHAGQHLATVATSRGQTLTTVGIDDGLVAWEEGVQRARGGGWLAVTVGASPFTRDLIVFVASIAERANEFSDEFRLWILAEERAIPYALTSACITVILEPAEGVKRAACSALESWSGPSVTGETARLAAGLALLHALVTERRAYIPIGWSRWYGWGWCEWRACQTALQTAGQAARPLCSSLYSSRVSERADRRVLLALEARCLSGTPALRLPSSATLQDYACSLESLPSSDSASLLQLSLNCRSARLQLHATHIMDGLREFNSTSRVKEEGSFTSSKILQSLWKKLMAGSPLLKPDYRVKDCVGWWGAVVSAEARDAARGVRLLHASLSAARFMSPMTQVPESWQLVWAGPDLPQDYLREFTSRARAAHQRTVEEAPTRQDYMPTELDLRLFLRPDRVLSALLALIASRLACPPATLVLTAQWNCTDGAADSGGLSVKGLSLSGGVWSSSDESGRERKGEGFVAAVSAESPALSDAPPILLRYVRRAEDSSQGSRDPQPTLIPLYESPRRETELCWIRAPLGASLTAQDAALHALALVVTPHD